MMTRGYRLQERLGLGSGGGLCAQMDPQEKCPIVLIAWTSPEYERLGLTRVGDGPNPGQSIYASVHTTADHVRLELPRYEKAGAIVIDLDDTVSHTPPETAGGEGVPLESLAFKRLGEKWSKSKNVVDVDFVDDGVDPEMVRARKSQVGEMISHVGTHAPGTHAPRVTEVCLGTLNYPGHSIRVHSHNVFGSQPSTPTSRVITALSDAIRKGRHVVNASLGGPRNAVYDYVAVEALRNGTILVAAAGNHGYLASPGANFHVCCGAATENLRAMTPWSGPASPEIRNFVSWVGRNILARLPLSSPWERLSGTSFSCPQGTAVIAALVGLLLDAGYSRIEAAKEALNMFFKGARPLGLPDSSAPQFKEGQGHGNVREAHLLYELSMKTHGTPKEGIATVEFEEGWNLPSRISAREAAKTINLLSWGFLGARKKVLEPFHRVIARGPVTPSMIHETRRDCLLVEPESPSGEFFVVDPERRHFLRLGLEKSSVISEFAEAAIPERLLPALSSEALPLKSRRPARIDWILARWWSGTRIRVRPVSYPILRVMNSAPELYAGLEVDGFLGGLLTCEDCAGQLRKISGLE